MISKAKHVRDIPEKKHDSKSLGNVRFLLRDSESMKILNQNFINLINKV